MKVNFRSFDGQSLRNPSGFWLEKNNHKRFLDLAGSKLNVKSHEDWYSISSTQVIECGGKGLLNHYNGSLIRALQSVYPNYKWDAGKFKHVQTGYFKDFAVKRQLFDFVGERLGIRTYEDWYKVKPSQVYDTELRYIIYRYYSGSMPIALSQIYPEYDWKTWNFTFVPKGYWDNFSSVASYIKYLSDQFGIVHLDDWHSITTDQIPKWGGLRKRYSSLLEILTLVYPYHNWKSKHPSKSTSKGQQYLYKALTGLFPNQEILINYKDVTMLYPNTNREIELDVYIPSLRLALEYQGQHHYHWHYWYGNPDHQRAVDQLKRTECLNRGITLIEVPYWWDRSKSSLAATILQRVPSITFTGITPSQPISTTPPAHHVEPKRTRRDGIPFVVTQYHGQGRSKCRGCLTKLKKGDFRIDIHCEFVPPFRKDMQPYPMKFSTCFKKACLDKALLYYSDKKNTAVRIPPFGNYMRVSDDIKHYIEDGTIPVAEFPQVHFVGQENS